MTDRETIVDRLRAAIARAKVRPQSREEQLYKLVEHFIGSQKPELSEGTSKETTFNRLRAAIARHREEIKDRPNILYYLEGPGLSEVMSKEPICELIKEDSSRVHHGGETVATGMVLLFLGLFTISAIGDPAHDIGGRDPKMVERAVGYSMLGLAVALMIAGGCLVGIKSDRELEKSIDLMLDMRELYPEVPADLDIKKVKQVLAVLPEILSHLSSSDKARLEVFVRGNSKHLHYEDIVAIKMAEHLKKHPEDLELVIDAYRGVVHFDYIQKQQNSTPDRGGR